MSDFPTNATGLEVVANHAYLYNRNGTYVADTMLTDNVEDRLALDDAHAAEIAAAWCMEHGYTVAKWTTSGAARFAAVTYDPATAEAAIAVHATPEDYEPEGVDGATVADQIANRPKPPSANYVARSLKRDAGIRSTAADHPGYHVFGAGVLGVGVSVDVHDIDRSNVRDAAALSEHLRAAGWSVTYTAGSSIVYVTRVPNARQAERRRVSLIAAQRRRNAIAGAVQA